MSELPIWLTPALDGAVLVMMGFLWWRLRHDPLAIWHAHEQRLQEQVESFRLLAAQSEGVARELDATLGVREQRLRDLAHETMAAARGAGARTASSREPERREAVHGDVVERVRRMAAAALPLEEIARRVEMPAAEVRVLVGLHTTASEDAPGRKGPAGFAGGARRRG